MMQTWSNWKRLSNGYDSRSVEAPIAPGIYEVRHTVTGRVVAFGWTSNVARALSKLNFEPGLANRFARFFQTPKPSLRVSDLEYRTCVAGSRAEAKTVARRLLGLRQTIWRQRWAAGSGARIRP
jgi:hypothetical protein